LRFASAVARNIASPLCHWRVPQLPRCTQYWPRFELARRRPHSPADWTRDDVFIAHHWRLLGGAEFCHRQNPLPAVGLVRGILARRDPSCARFVARWRGIGSPSTRPRSPVRQWRPAAPDLRSKGAGGGPPGRRTPRPLAAGLRCGVGAGLWHDVQRMPPEERWHGKKFFSSAPLSRRTYYPSLQ